MELTEWGCSREPPHGKAFVRRRYVVKSLIDWSAAYLVCICYDFHHARFFDSPSFHRSHLYARKDDRSLPDQFFLIRLYDDLCVIFLSLWFRSIDPIYMHVIENRLYNLYSVFLNVYDAHISI